MKSSLFAAVVTATGAVLLLGACAPTSPRVDSRFGESTRMLVAQQTLNPDAGNRQVPESMDASAARESLERYRTSFREPQAPQNVFNIGLGSGGR